MIANGTGTHEAERAGDSPLRPRLDGRRPDAGPDAFLARGRARWLRRCLDALGERPASMVALGWDRGAINSELFANLHIRSLVSIDVAPERLHSAELQSADGRATLVHVSDYRASESADLAFTHGVFGHMPERERAAAAVLVYRSLKPGGLFSVCQSNPWSPGSILSARQTLSRGETSGLTPRATRRLLRGVGFDVLDTTSAFFFPQAFTWFQPLEPWLAPIPLGGEYMVLARKP